MASPAQILANRANARLSTGPRTSIGKAASAQNSHKHGLSSPHFALMPNEDPAQFAELLAGLQAEFQPATPHEHFLVETAAKSRWKIMRIERLEEEAFDELFTDPAAPGESPDAQLLNAIKPNSNIHDKLVRYSTAAERSYLRAVRELQAIRAQKAREQTQKARVQNEANQYLLDCLLGTPPPNGAEPPVQNEPNPIPAVTVRSARTAPPARGTAS